MKSSMHVRAPFHRSLVVAAACAAAALAGGLVVDPVSAAEQAAPPATTLKHYDVTIRVFDPDGDRGAGRDYVLPVDSPDEEHAAASTLANAAAFTTKTRSGVALPVAFRCVKVEPRR